MDSSKPKLIATVALLLTLSLASASAAAEPGLMIEVEGCNDIDADAIAQIVAADFKEANEGKSTITIVCVKEVASFSMLEAGTTRRLNRTVDLSTVDPIARPRMLALLVVELLDIAEPALETAPQAEVQAEVGGDAKVGAEALAARAPAGPGATKTIALAAAPPIPPRPALRQPTIVAGLDLGVASRSFNYRVPGGVSNAANVRPYDAPLVPIARLEALAYPFAKDGHLAGLGASGSYAAAQTVLSSSADGMRLESSRSEWDLNLRYQRVLKIANVAAEVGLGRQRFSFREEEPGSAPDLIDEVPTVSIRYARVGLDADFPITSTIGITVGLEYRIIGSIGDLAEHFTSTEVLAWAADLGAHYWITDAVRLRLMYLQNSYSYTFQSMDQVTEARGDDTFTTLIFGLGWQH